MNKLLIGKLLLPLILVAMFIFSFEAERIYDVDVADSIVMVERMNQSTQANAESVTVINSAANSAAVFPSGPIEKESPGDVDILTQPDANPNYSTFGDRYSEISARRNGRFLDPQEILNASREETAWQPDEAASQELDLSNEDLTDGREFIKFNPMKLESLVAGDRFEISLSQTAKTYTMIVEEVQSHDDGRNVTWRGKIEGVDGFNFVTLTRGEDLVVGGITTPEGNYQIEVHGENGWIANSTTLFKGVDQQVVVPPEYIENPPADVVYLPAETFGESTQQAN